LLLLRFLLLRLLLLSLLGCRGRECLLERPTGDETHHTHGSPLAEAMNPSLGLSGEEERHQCWLHKACPISRSFIRI